MAFLSGLLIGGFVGFFAAGLCAMGKDDRK